MKDRLIILAMFAAVIFGMPLILGRTSAEASDLPISEVQSVTFPDEISLYIEDEDRLVTVSAEEYLTGCICAQIPINYEPETLKAQAAASATYALKLMQSLGGSGKLPDGADISDSPRLCQPYFDERKRKEMYGSDYDKFAEYITAAAKYGKEHIITYENAPIHAVYHSLCAGRTCPSQYVWGSSYPYLAAADSPWDTGYINYECTNEMTSAEAWAKLLAYDRSMDIPVDCANWFTEMNANEDGYVISVNIGKNKFTGGDIWRIFGLRSTAFTVSYEDGIFTFTTKGAGHCSGLSQYGANELAKSGASAEKILHHYYGDAVNIG